MVAPAASHYPSHRTEHIRCIYKLLTKYVVIWGLCYHQPFLEGVFVLSIYLNKLITKVQLA